MKYFTVGPVQMYDDIIKLGGIQTPYFRNQEFSNIMYSIDTMLKQILNMGEEDKNIYLTASGTGAMEAVIINFFRKTDKLLIINGGGFGKRFIEICEIHGIPADEIAVNKGETFEPDAIVKYSGKGYTALLVNIHETSIGQLYPKEVLVDFCKKEGLYLIVDGISSVFADFHDFMNDGFDAFITSSQKALALPPGVSVVSLSSRIIKERLQDSPPTYYFNFNDYIKNMERGQTPFTPAVGIFIQMEAALHKIMKMGYYNLCKKTEEIATKFRNEINKIGLSYPNYPMSNAMTPVYFKGRAKEVYERLVSEYGITVNPCGGELANEMIRVGHMGCLKWDDYECLIEALKQML